MRCHGLLPLALCAVLGTVGSGARAEEPPAPPAPTPLPVDPAAPPAVDPAGDPASEVVLEGDALKAYEREKKEHLQILRKEKNRELVVNHISVLGTRGGRAVRDALITFAGEIKNQEYLNHTFLALAKIGGPIVVDFLTGKLALRADDFMVQQSAATSLETVKHPRATAALLDVMTDKRTKIEVVGACAKALARSAPTDERVVETIFEYAKHRKDTIRSYSLEALGWLATDAAVERLKDALKNDKNTRARGAAATGMGHTKRAELVPLLQETIRTETALPVKECASKAIQEIEGKSP